MNKLVIVDDHAVVRHGLLKAFESHGFEVTAAVENVAQARSAIAAMVPNVVIVDINLPDATGFDLVKWIRSINRELPIIIVSLNDSPEYINAARACGANAYVAKTAAMEEIVATVNFAIKSPRSFTSKNRGSSFENSLTAREIDVLALIEKGFSNAEISQRLHISLSTVKTHVSSILQKLSTTSRVGAVKVARETGLIPQ
jgi:two-component system NarL family response regulator